MRYVHFDEVMNQVKILTYESTEHGVVVGSVSEEDFAKTSTKFLVQALMIRANLHHHSGVDIIVDDTPPF